MNIPIPAWVQHHLWWAFLLLIFAVNSTTALPTPKNPDGLYGFIFNFMHLTFGGIPRLIITNFPNSWLAKLFTGGRNGNGSSNGSVVGSGDSSVPVASVPKASGTSGDSGTGQHL